MIKLSKQEIIENCCKSMAKTKTIEECCIHTIEECSEVTQACTKLLRYLDGNKDNYKLKDVGENIIEEIADVIIMINQLKYLLQISNEELSDKMIEKIIRYYEQISIKNI